MLSLCPSRITEERRLEALRRYDILDTPEESRFDNITLLAQQIMATPMAAISLIEKDRLWMKSRIGIEAQELPREVTFCAHVVDTKAPVVVPDALTDVRFKSNPLVVEHPNVRFYAGMPLVTRDNATLGAVFVLDTAPRQDINPQQLQALYALSRITVDAIELRSLAMYDSLTDILSQGAFRQAAQREFERASAAAGRSQSVIVTDIDHFKRINDTWGHAAGDHVLRHFADLLRTASRQTDIVGRVGGEEFAVILPDCDAEGAAIVAEDVRAALAGSPIMIRGEKVTVTASFGVAQMLPGDRSLEGAMARADAALYRSKNAGRNRVTAADRLLAADAAALGAPTSAR